MSPRTRFEVVVVGASIAGCTAARMFGIAGARVALVERKPDAGAYKVVCTHQVQRSATPTIERIGLASLLDERGAVRAHPEVWSPHGGRISFPDDVGHGYGVTRWTLDPMMRELAAGTPGVELLLGRSVVALRHDRGRVSGVEVESRDRRRQAVDAMLVVGADGRHSTVARLARMRGRVRRNERFAYFAYWRGLPPSNRARLWFLDPDGAAVFPNEDGIVLIAAVPHKRRLPAFRTDLEGSYARMIAELPGGPELEGAERISKLIGALDAPNVLRPASRPGIALVGDAALTADPLYGVGCGWAFQTAEWLVDQTAAAVRGDGELDRALARYRRQFLLRLGPHLLQIADYSTGRPLRANERMAFRAAASDPRVARDIEGVASRSRSPLVLAAPAPTARVLRAAAGAAARNGGG